MSTTEFDPNSVEWSEPPISAPNASVRNYGQLVQALRERPNEWAVVRHDAETSKVQDLRNVKGVEVTSRPNVDQNGKRTGTSTVWAKWVGLDEFGETILSPEAQARREARAARKAAREAAAQGGENATEADSDPFA